MIATPSASISQGCVLLRIAQTKQKALCAAVLTLSLHTLAQLLGLAGLAAFTIASPALAGVVSISALPIASLRSRPAALDTSMPARPADSCPAHEPHGHTT